MSNLAMTIKVEAPDLVAALVRLAAAVNPDPNILTPDEPRPQMPAPASAPAPTTPPAPQAQMTAPVPPVAAPVAPAAPVVPVYRSGSCPRSCAACGRSRCPSCACPGSRPCSGGSCCPRGRRSHLHSGPDRQGRGLLGGRWQDGAPAGPLEALRGPGRHPACAGAVRGLCH